ncbi:MAG TPA: M23 family metallopeptidase, partial [Caulobacteraceae bacterium]
VLIALNGLGDEGRVRVAQRLILPDSAVDQGRDPYATGPAPERTEERVSGSLPPPPGPPVEDRPRRPAQTETYLPNPPARQPEVQPAPRLPRPAPPTASTEGDRVYVVQPGDALSGVARRFGAPVQSLMDLNGLDPRGGVRAGQRLVLPEGARDSGPDPLATGATPAGVPGAIGGPRQSAPSGEARPADRRPTTSTTRPPAATGDGFPDAAELRRQAGGRFAWPVRGDITARFGTQGVGLRSDGIDISGPAGGQVRAAAPGTVAFAGPVVGAGNTVVIDHGANWVSVYSNLGSADVRMERRVEQGDVVGRAGSGAVASPVHFEIRYRTSQRERARPVDPLPLLP